MPVTVPAAPSGPLKLIVKVPFASGTIPTTRRAVPGSGAESARPAVLDDSGAEVSESGAVGALHAEIAMPTPNTPTTHRETTDKLDELGGADVTGAGRSNNAAGPVSLRTDARSREFPGSGVRGRRLRTGQDVGDVAKTSAG